MRLALLLAIALPGTAGAEPFTSIAHALAEAQPGDTIVVPAGDYFESNTIALDGIELVADGQVRLYGRRGTCAPSAPPIRVDGAHGVVLRGFVLIPASAPLCGGPSGNTEAAGTSALEARNASVRLEDCTLRANIVTATLSAEDSDVALANTTVDGPRGLAYYQPLSGPPFVLPSAGGAAVELERSRLLAEGSTLAGGEGGDGVFAATIFVSIPGYPGGPAIRADGESSVVLLHSAATGGRGGDKSTGSNSGRGGCGIEGAASTGVSHVGSAIAGGEPGAGGTAPPGEALCGVELAAAGSVWSVL